MKSQSALWAFALIALTTLLSLVAAGRLALRPLTPQEVGRALVEAGLSEDDVKPMGRVTPAAYAGLGGFTLGMANGVGTAVLFDMLVSNETANMINQMINSMNSTTNIGGKDRTTQEICFGGDELNRNLAQANNDNSYDNDIIDDDDDDVAEFAYDDDLADGEEEGRQYDEYYYDDTDTGGVGGGNGITCIVVNRGRALVRHRRSPVKQISPPRETQSPSKTN